MCLDKAVNSSQGLLNDEVASYLTFLCGSGRVESLVGRPSLSHGECFEVQASWTCKEP